MSDSTRSVEIQLRTSNEMDREVFPGSTGSGYSTANGEKNSWVRKVPVESRTDRGRSWTVRGDFAGRIRPAGADPMDQLTNSVVRIETLLKRQLPDGVV